MSKPKNKLLSVTVTRDGVLRIEIGIEVLANAAAYAAFDPSPDDAYPPRKVTNSRGWAADVKAALLDESEDGSTLVTRMLDCAFDNAIEDGSEHIETLASADLDVRQRAFEIAKAAAKAAPPSYAAAKAAPPSYYTSDDFVPHAWVVDAVESALKAVRK